MTDAWRIDPAIWGQCAERRVVAVAEAQHAMIHRRQLLRIGLSSGAVDYRVATGRLHPMHRGVYALGHRVVSLRGRWMAAVLACGPDGVLSHRDAAALHGLRQPTGTRFEVTAPRGAGRRRGAIRPVRRGLGADEVTRVDNIPTTTWTRTLIDLAAVVPSHDLARAVEQAEVLRIFDLDELQPLLERHRGRPGVGALSAAVRAHRPEQRTRSDLEALLVDLCRKAGIPPATSLNRSMTLPGGRVVQPDAVWHDQRVIVEVDGFEFHGTRRAFEADRIRDAELQILGWRVLRTTWLQLERTPHAFLNRLRRLLQTG